MEHDARRSVGVGFRGPLLCDSRRLGRAESQQNIACYFSPKGGCTDAVVAEIVRARQTILIQAYSFTSTPIAKALVDAHQRGVQITVVLDKSNLTGQYSSADFVLHASIPTYIDDKHAIAHNKIMLIDGRTIITGSFNFTKQAESSNAENLLVIRDRPELFAQYQANFQKHLDHSQSYQGRPNVESAGLQGDGDQGIRQKHRTVAAKSSGSFQPLDELATDPVAAFAFRHAEGRAADQPHRRHARFEGHHHVLEIEQPIPVERHSACRDVVTGHAAKIGRPRHVFARVRRHSLLRRKSESLRIAALILVDHSPFGKGSEHAIDFYHVCRLHNASRSPFVRRLRVL